MVVRVWLTQFASLAATLALTSKHISMVAISTGATVSRSLPTIDAVLMVAWHADAPT